MKRFLAILLALTLLASLASCASSTEDKDSPANATEAAAVQSTYILSDNVKEGSVIDGLMTDISGKDDILQRSYASWADTCVMYEVNIRQFTVEGTFAAFEGHLERLKAMGVNTLWLMPIHPISETNRKGALGSYYSVSNYTGVNPEFGTAEDFRHLVDKAHGMGFKVMLDWVANHTGWDHPWITEHEDWYVHRSNGEIESPYDWTDTAKLDYDNYEMRAEMIRSMVYWVEEFGVDGFRCDHAIGVPAPFWNAAVYKLKSVNSEILMLAESNTSQSLLTYAFDSCYNDNLYGQIATIGGGVALDEIQKHLDVRTAYSQGSFPMNYLDNHDQNTNGTVVKRCGDAYPALLALTFTAPGYPMIYTANEQGYDHSIAFFEKDPVIWDDAPQYAPLIAALSALKTTQKALASSNADITFFDASNRNVLAFSRPSDDGALIYIANLFDGDLADIDVAVDFASATCVMHYDGSTLSAEPTAITKADFDKAALHRYEFYILRAD